MQYSAVTVRMTQNTGILYYNVMEGRMSVMSEPTGDIA